MTATFLGSAQKPSSASLNFGWKNLFACCYHPSPEETDGGESPSSKRPFDQSGNVLTTRAQVHVENGQSYEDTALERSPGSVHSGRSYQSNRSSLPDYPPPPPPTQPGVPFTQPDGRLTPTRAAGSGHLYIQRHSATPRGSLTGIPPATDFAARSGRITPPGIASTPRGSFGSAGRASPRLDERNASLAGRVATPPLRTTPQGMNAGAGAATGFAAPAIPPDAASIMSTTSIPISAGGSVGGGAGAGREGSLGTPSASISIRPRSQSQFSGVNADLGVVHEEVEDEGEGGSQVSSVVGAAGGRARDLKSTLFQTLGRISAGSHAPQEEVAPAEEDEESAAATVEVEGEQQGTHKGDKQVIVARVALQINYEVRKGVMDVQLTSFQGTQELERIQFTPYDSLQLRLALLPKRKERFKSRNKPIAESSSVITYNEKWHISHLLPSQLATAGLRVRAYKCTRSRRDQLLGECSIAFLVLDLKSPCIVMAHLEATSSMLPAREAKSPAPAAGAAAAAGGGGLGRPGSALDGNLGPLADVAMDSASITTRTSSIYDGSRSEQLSTAGSVASIAVQAELMIGLSYNSLTARLAVEVVKGTNFTGSSNHKPDPYVKIIVMDATGHKKFQSKTSVRGGEINPMFQETYLYDLPQSQLKDVTVIVSVYNNKARSKKKALIGWFSLGAEPSGADEKQHWDEMKGNRGQQILRWHTLLRA